MSWLTEAPTNRSRLGSLSTFPFSLWLFAFFLSGIGLLFLHSTEPTKTEYLGQTYRQTQAIFLLGFGMIPMAWVRRRTLLGFTPWIYGFSCLSLLLLPFFGVTINGARRWFALGSATIQPAEFAKPALILALAFLLRERRENSWWGALVFPGLVLALPFALIASQPDLGSALSLIPVYLAICFAAGASGRKIILLLFLGLLAVAALYPFLHEYQKARILVWLGLDQLSGSLGAGYHLKQSLIAVGGGGMFGQGLFQGAQNVYDYLPYRSTDFLFAVIAEETGFFGSSAFILLYASLSLLIFRKASQIPDRFGRLLCVGTGAFFASHLLIHTGVCTGLLPPTGLPLPLLSYGRSSVAGAWLCMALVGHACVRGERSLAGGARA
jgi:rod shape determining protein RodA